MTRGGVDRIGHRAEAATASVRLFAPTELRRPAPDHRAPCRECFDRLQSVMGVPSTFQNAISLVLPWLILAELLDDPTMAIQRSGLSLQTKTRAIVGQRKTPPRPEGRGGVEMFH
jgi:hypothetical protein